MTLAGLTPLVLLLALGSGPAFAAGCNDARTQAEMTGCAAQALQAADDRLNDRYQKLLRRLDGAPPVAAKLRASEKAWIAFRDAECAFESAGSEGGSAQPMVIAQCRTRLTSARADMLEAQLTCPEGDLSCPAPVK